MACRWGYRWQGGECIKIDQCQTGIGIKCSEFPGSHCINQLEYTDLNDGEGYICQLNECEINLEPCSEQECQIKSPRRWLPSPIDHLTGNKYRCNSDIYKDVDGGTVVQTHIDQLKCGDETDSDDGLYYKDGCPVIRDEDCIGFWSICDEECSQEYTISREKSGSGKRCPILEGSKRSCSGGLCCEGITCQERTNNCVDKSYCKMGVCQPESQLPDGTMCKYYDEEGSNEMNGICSNGECSPTVEDGDCIGVWKECKEDCTKEYNITRLRTGNGDICEYRIGATTQCSPGEGQCPSSDKGSKCKNVCQSSNECKVSSCIFDTLTNEYKCKETLKDNNVSCQGGFCRDGFCISTECPLGCPTPISECKLSGVCIGNGECSEEVNKSDGTDCSEGICKEGICIRTNDCRSFDCQIKENSLSDIPCLDNKCSEQQCCKGFPLPTVTCREYLDEYPCKGDLYLNTNDKLTINENGSTNCCSDLVCNEQEYCYESTDKCIKDEENGIVVKYCNETKIDDYEVINGLIKKCQEHKKCIYSSDIELPQDGSSIEWAKTSGDGLGINYKYRNGSYIHIKAPKGMVIEFLTHTPTKIVKYRTNQSIIPNIELFLKEEAYSPSNDIDGWGGLFYKKNENEDWSYLKNTYYVRALCNTVTCDQDCVLRKDRKKSREVYTIDIPKSGEGLPCDRVSTDTSFFKTLNWILFIIGILFIVIIIIRVSGPDIKESRSSPTLQPRTIKVITDKTLAELMKQGNK